MIMMMLATLASMGRRSLEMGEYSISDISSLNPRLAEAVKWYRAIPSEPRKTIVTYNYGAENLAEDAASRLAEAVEPNRAVPEIRPIGGGTKFRITYGGDWAEEMRGAFEYACRIWEETLPPCLPFTIHAEIAELDGANKNALSKAAYAALDGIGTAKSGLLVPVAQIKRVSLLESETGMPASFGAALSRGKNVHGSLFDESTPDITLTYNKSKLDEFDFTLGEVAADKYDFVTLVLRDIAYGLGFGNRFSKNSEDNALAAVAGAPTFYENRIWEALGSRDLQQAYANATSGYVDLGEYRLYAPETWSDGVSLKTFIPDGSQIGALLTNEFAKGYMHRGLDAGAWHELTETLLNWRTDGSSSTADADGTTETVMPYNGSISFTFGDGAKSVLVEKSRLKKMVLNSGNNPTVEQMCRLLHPFYKPDANACSGQGWTVALLLDDGQWDVVYKNITTAPSDQLDISMSDLNFHYDKEKYARNCDGHLRARVTQCKEVTDHYYGPKMCYTIQYFNMDYLPQTIEMGVCELGASAPAQQTLAAEPRATGSVNVKVGMRNLEGITRVVIEVKREGFRLPTRFDVSDFNKGYFVTTIDNDRKTTFTAIGYNANGSTRSLPITVNPVAAETQRFTMNLTGDVIALSENLEGDVPLTSYMIMPLQAKSTASVKEGSLDGGNTISVAELPKGYYVLTCSDAEGEKYSFKFAR